MFSNRVGSSRLRGALGFDIGSPFVFVGVCSGSVNSTARCESGANARW